MESSAINMVAGVTMLLILLTGTMNVMATAVIANILLSPFLRGRFSHGRETATKERQAFAGINTG